MVIPQTSLARLILLVFVFLAPLVKASDKSVPAVNNEEELDTLDSIFGGGVGYEVEGGEVDLEDLVNPFEVPSEDLKAQVEKEREEKRRVEEEVKKRREAEEAEKKKKPVEVEITNYEKKETTKMVIDGKAEQRGLRLNIPAHYAQWSQRQVVEGDRKYSGLYNWDALTCYMASVTQAIFHIKPLRAAILAMPCDEARDPILFGMQVVLSLLQTKQTGIAVDMYPSLVAYYRDYKPYGADVDRMDDAREFFQHLENFTRQATRDIINANRVRRTVTADDMIVSDVVDAEPNVFVAFNVLSVRKEHPEIDSVQKWLDMGDVSPLEAYNPTRRDVEADARQLPLIQRYMEQKQVGWDENGVLKIRGNLKNTIKLESAGPVLTIWLGRYTYDRASGHRPVYDPNCHVIYEPEINVNGVMYDLHGLVHYESLHYKTYTRSANHADQWLLLNNDHVSVVSQAEALSHLGNAYLLFYTRRGWIAQSDVTEPDLPLLANPAFLTYQFVDESEEAKSITERMAAYEPFKAEKTKKPVFPVYNQDSPYSQDPEYYQHYDESTSSSYHNYQDHAQMENVVGFSQFISNVGKAARNSSSDDEVRPDEEWE